MMSYECPLIAKSRSPKSLANLAAEIKASCSPLFLLALNVKCRNYFIVIPLSSSRINAARLPLMLEAPLKYSIHIFSCLFSIGRDDNSMKNLDKLGP